MPGSGGQWRAETLVVSLLTVGLIVWIVLPPLNAVLARIWPSAARSQRRLATPTGVPK